jgi:nucleotide-binding universal stress UspA family protein
LPKDRRGLIVTVWGPIAEIPFGGIAVYSGTELDGEIEKEARQTAEEGKALLEDSGFDATIRLERGLPLWERIVDVSEAEDAAMIVLGSHGRSGVKSVLLGSVATAVSQHSKRPVLIVH